MLPLLLNDFRYLNDALFETHPYREVQEELIDNASCLNTLLLQDTIVTPLSEEHLRNANFEYLGRFEEQSCSRQDFSTLTYRIMHNFRFRK